MQELTFISLPRVIVCPAFMSMDNGNAPVPGVVTDFPQEVASVKVRVLPAMLTLPPVLAVKG